jgi:PBP1b-binding outer membrane lipoprotein LpoB
MIRSITAAALGIVLLLAGCSATPSAPEAGSPADQYCDTNSQGPDTVALGGKRYDQKCLDNYPWTK